MWHLKIRQAPSALLKTGDRHPATFVTGFQSVWRGASPLFQRAPGLALVTALLLVGQDAWGARLIRFQIMMDGQLVMTAISGDSGREDAVEVWARLEKAKWQIESGFTPPVDPANSTQANLRGDIEIVASHAHKRVVAQAKVRELALIRDTSDPQVWRMPAAEITRTGLAAGFLPANLANASRPPAVARAFLPSSRLLSLVAVILVFLTACGLALWLACGSKKENMAQGRVNGEKVASH